MSLRSRYNQHNRNFLDSMASVLQEQQLQFNHACKAPNNADIPKVTEVGENLSVEGPIP